MGPCLPLLTSALNHAEKQVADPEGIFLINALDYETRIELR